LLSNVDISARIKELQTRITDAVIAKVVLDRVRRIAILAFLDPHYICAFER
jgi:hypothetical protein